MFRQYQVGQLYAVAEASKGETGGGEGVKVLRNEPYENKNEKGQYTHKIYYLQSKVPAWIKKIAPKGALEIHEEAWNAYPYCRTVLTNPGYMCERFIIEVITWHKPDMGTQENVHGLCEEEWKQCKVINIDIAVDKDIPSKDYKEEEDPKKFKSSSGRGPLLEGWQKDLESDTSTPHMCCYKLVKADFRMFGLQNRVESTIQNFENRLFKTFNRKVFCSLDKWQNMTMKDIRALEDETQTELDKMRSDGAIKGTTAD